MAISVYDTISVYQPLPYYICFVFKYKNHSFRFHVYFSALSDIQSLLPFQHGDRLYTSESDVCRRQTLTYKDDPRSERIKIFIIVIDP